MQSKVAPPKASAFVEKDVTDTGSEARVRAAELPNHNTGGVGELLNFAMMRKPSHESL